MTECTASRCFMELRINLRKNLYDAFSSRHRYLLESIKQNFSKINPKPDAGGAEAGGPEKFGLILSSTNSP